MTWTSAKLVAPHNRSLEQQQYMHCVSYTEVKLVRCLIIQALQIYINIFLCFKKHGKCLKLCKNCGLFNTLATRNLVLQYISCNFSNNQLISRVWFSVHIETFRDRDLVYKTEWHMKKYADHLALLRTAASGDQFQHNI